MFCVVLSVTFLMPSCCIGRDGVAKNFGRPDHSVSIITNSGTTLCAKCPERKSELSYNIAISYVHIKIVCMKFTRSF